MWTQFVPQFWNEQFTHRKAIDCEYASVGQRLQYFLLEELVAADQTLAAGEQIFQTGSRRQFLDGCQQLFKPRGFGVLGLRIAGKFQGVRSHHT